MSPRFRFWLLLALGVGLAAWGWLDVRRRGRIDPNNPAVHKTDFTIYTEAGAAFFDGRDPYAVKNVRGWEYLYPPLLAMLVAPLHRLAPQDQVFLWFLISTACGVAAVWECRKISMHVWSEGGDARPPPTWLGPLALLAGLLPMLNTLQRGQVGTVVLWSLLLGFRWAVVEQRSWKRLLGGAILALPIVIKLTPALPVSALLLTLTVRGLCGRARGDGATMETRVGVARARSLPLGVLIGVAAGLMLGVFIIPTSLIGWEANLRHLGRWWTGVVTNPDLAADTRLVLESVRNQSLANALPLMLGGPSSVAQAARWVLSAVVVGCLAIVILRERGCATVSLAAATVFALSGVASLLLSPVSWGHHFVLFMPAAAFVPLALLADGRRIIAVLLAATPGLLTFAHYAFLDSVGRVGVLGIGTFAWFCAASAALILRPSRGENRD